MPGYGTLYGDLYGGDSGDLTPGSGLDLLNQSPVPDAFNVGIGDSITFSVVDNAQVVLSSVKVYVSGYEVFNGSSFQVGWGSSSYSANAYHGWDFALLHDSYLDYNAVVSVRVVAQDESANQLDETWMFTTVEKEKKANIQIKCLAVNILRVYFPEPVVTSSDLTLISNYTSTTITEGANDVEILSVRGIEAELGVVSSVDVYISRVSLEAVYRLEVRNQRNAKRQILTSGLYIGMAGLFAGRITKTDSMRGAVAGLYDTTGTASTMLQVLMAMALEDERVGGQGDLSPTPIPVIPPTTFGTATYGTGTYDGLTAFGEGEGD